MNENKPHSQTLDETSVFPAESVPEAETPAVPPKGPSRPMRWLRQFLFSPETPSRLLFLLGPWVSYLCMEYLNENNPFTALTATQLLFSMLWYYLIYLVGRLLVGRTKAAAAGSAVVLFLAGLANHYVLLFRGRTIFPCDLVTLGTAANVAESYDYTPDRNMWIAIGILAVFLVLLALPPHLRGRRKLHKATCAVSWTAAAIFLYAFFFTPLLPDSGIYAQQWKTQANGFMLNFMTALRYSFVSAPDDYSVKAAQEIADKASAPVATPISTTQTEPPTNLIVIMNESFSDLQSSFPNLELTADPLSFLHSLTKNTIKGTMISPVTGGGTANVEFEYLTGDSLAFLPSATVAYQLYCYNGMPSMVSQMESQGYRTVSLHPYLASGWNRTSVYKWMGFDKSLFIDDVVDPQYIRSYVSDASDYQQIYRLTDETDGPLFVFNVTMQNHSGYAQGWNNLERSVELTGTSTGISAVADQYFSLLKASDDAIRDLITHYQNSDERTMIVFFGDHEPPLGNSFFEKLYGKKLDDRTTQEVLQQYETPFFIWANYDIPEKSGLVISTNLLGTLTMQLAGIPLTNYENLHAKMLNTLPVNSTVGFETSADQITSDEQSLPSSIQSLYEDYRIMAYNHLFDSAHHPDKYYN